MTQEQKELLLKELCARLPYGVKAHIEHDTFYDEIEPYDGTVNTNTINDLLHNEKLEVRPYLRLISSITEEEERELNGLLPEVYDFTFRMEELLELIQTQKEIPFHYIDWFNSHHFDYRGLIPMGLALEAPKNMYKI